MISESQKRGSCLIDLCFWSQLTGRSTANSPSLKVVSRYTHSYALLAQCEVSGGITTLFKSNYNCIRWPSNEPISLSCRDCTNKDIISLTLFTHIIMWPKLFFESMLRNKCWATQHTKLWIIFKLWVSYPWLVSVTFILYCLS